MAKKKTKPVRKQGRLFSKGDPIIAQKADVYLELMETLADAKESLGKVGDEHIGMMKSAKLKQFRHGGKLIALKHIDEGEKLVVKKTKTISPEVSP